MKKNFFLIAVASAVLACGSAFAADKANTSPKVPTEIPNSYKASDAATPIEELYNTLAATDKLPAYNVGFAYIHGVVEAALVMELATVPKGSKHVTLCGMFDANGNLDVKISDAVRAVIRKIDGSELDTDKKRSMGASQYILAKLDGLYGCQK